MFLLIIAITTKEIITAYVYFRVKHDYSSRTKFRVKIVYLQKKKKMKNLVLQIIHASLSRAECLNAGLNNTRRRFLSFSQYYIIRYVFMRYPYKILYGSHTRTHGPERINKKSK